MNVVTRRERQRQEVVEEIKAVARAQLAEGGRAGIGLRAIARQVGLSPAGMYTYVGGVDDIITALIADSFTSLAAALASAASAESSPLERLRAAAVAYRAWAVANPEEFRLLYTSPIKGYAAPADGPTTPAAIRVNLGLFGPLAEAWQAGALAPPRPGYAVDAGRLPGELGLAATPDQLRTAVRAWARLHGLVMLELHGHLPGLAADPDAWFAAEVDDLLADLAAGRV